MVFLPSRPTAHEREQVQTDTETEHSVISPGARTIVDLVDVVGTIRDVDHLQSVAFLAQEFGLLAAPTFLFGSRRCGGDEGSAGAAPGGVECARPHSALLEGHFYALLCEKVIDRDGTGRLSPRRDLYAVPHSGLAGRRLSTLAALSPRDTAVFAAAVLRLARQGCYAGSRRHDAAFYDAVALLAALDEGEPAVDTAAIYAARRRLIPAEPLQLTSGQLAAVGR